MESNYYEMRWTVKHPHKILPVQFELPLIRGLFETHLATDFSGWVPRRLGGKCYIHLEGSV